MFTKSTCIACALLSVCRSCCYKIKPQNRYYLLKKEHTDEPLRTKEDVAAPLGIRLISDHCYKNESYVLNFFDTHSKRNDAFTFNIKYKLQCTLTAAI